MRVGSLPALLKLSDAESDASAVLASAKAATSVALNSAALKGQAEPVEIESVICGQQH